MKKLNLFMATISMTTLKVQAHSITQQDVNCLKQLSDKNLIETTSDSVYLSEQLKNEELINYLKSSKATNCGGWEGPSK